MAKSYYRPSNVVESENNFNEWEITLKFVYSDSDNQSATVKEIVLFTDNKKLADVLAAENPHISFISEK